MSGLVVLPGSRMLRKFTIIVLVHIMASLFFSCDVWRAAREVVPADSISTSCMMASHEIAFYKGWAEKYMDLTIPFGQKKAWPKQLAFLVGSNRMVCARIAGSRGGRSIKLLLSVRACSRRIL